MQGIPDVDASLVPTSSVELRVGFLFVVSEVVGAMLVVAVSTDIIGLKNNRLLNYPQEKLKHLFFKINKYRRGGCCVVPSIEFCDCVSLIYIRRT